MNIYSLDEALLAVRRFGRGDGVYYFGRHTPTADNAFELMLKHPFATTRLGSGWEHDVRWRAVGILMDYACRRLYEIEVLTAEEAERRGNPLNIALLFSRDYRDAPRWMWERFRSMSAHEQLHAIRWQGDDYLDGVMARIVGMHHTLATYDIAFVARLLDQIFKLSHAPHRLCDRSGDTWSIADPPNPVSAFFNPLVEYFHAGVTRAVRLREPVWRNTR